MLLTVKSLSSLVSCSPTSNAIDAFWHSQSLLSTPVFALLLRIRQSGLYPINQHHPSLLWTAPGSCSLKPPPNGVPQKAYGMNSSLCVRICPNWNLQPCWHVHHRCVGILYGNKDTKVLATNGIYQGWSCFFVCKWNGSLSGKVDLWNGYVEGWWTSVRDRELVMRVGRPQSMDVRE